MKTKYYFEDKLINISNETELLNKICELKIFDNIEYMISAVNTKCDHNGWSQDVELVKTVRNIKEKINE